MQKQNICIIIFILYLSVDFKQYLIEQKIIQLSAVAKLMWPNNKNAAVYLSMKLKGERPWTEKDNQNAQQAIRILGEELIKESKS